MTLEEVKMCFLTAIKDEEKGMKHKGLLIEKPSHEKAEEYILKAKEELEVCGYFKQRGTDYKIPEQWYYTLYYCALAILAKFGVESRSQRCTALFIQYLQDKGLIEYEKEFIDMILVYKEKDKKSEVDRREEARYGSWIKNEEVRSRYNLMIDICKKAISKAEEIIYSKKECKVPEELLL